MLEDAGSAGSNDGHLRVTHGDPPQPNVGEYSLNSQVAILTSYDFGKHVNTALGLSNLWGISEDKAIAKIRNSISVRAGSDPGLFVVTITGLEHPLTVKILNELCTYYTEQQLSESSSDEKPQAIHVSIIQRAQ
jgi:hypothetical protein